MLVKTTQGRFRVRVKDRRVVISDRTTLADVYAAWACIRPAQVGPRPAGHALPGHRPAGHRITDRPDGVRQCRWRALDFRGL